MSIQLRWRTPPMKTVLETLELEIKLNLQSPIPDLRFRGEDSA